MGGFIVKTGERNRRNTGDVGGKDAKPQPAANDFGAEVTGLELKRPLAAATLTAVKRAWAQFSILYFPDQPLSLAELAAFTLQFGTFGDDPYVKPLPGYPNILEIRREANEKASVFGAAWHSDWSFQHRPPSATILHAKVVPPIGGNTLFADGYRAFEALSPAFQQLLKARAGKIGQGGGQETVQPPARMRILRLRGARILGEFRDAGFRIGHA